MKLLDRLFLYLTDRIHIPPCTHSEGSVRVLCPKPCDQIHTRCRGCSEVIDGTCTTD